MRGRLLVLLSVLTLGASCVTLPAGGSSAPERWAFTAPWDPASASSVREHAGVLDAVVLDWIQLDTISGLPLAPYRDSLSAGLPARVQRMALVTSFLTDRFNPAVLRRLSADGAALSAASRAIAERLHRGGYRGMVLDFEGMTVADSAVTRSVVAAIADAAHAAHVGPVVVALPAGDTMAYPTRLFDGSADLLLVMLYDQHWATSAPGPIAAPEWVRRTLAMRVAESAPDRVVAALPLYGYLWRPGVAEASTISLDDARHFASEARVPLARDPTTATLHATRAGADGWELWVSDAVLLSALEREAAVLGVRRFAYWRLGLEDAAFWTAIGR